MIDASGKNGIGVLRPVFSTSPKMKSADIEPFQNHPKRFYPEIGEISKKFVEVRIGSVGGNVGMMKVK